MSNSFTNWLSKSGSTIFKSYSHATGLYVNDTYARAPKLGFLYFVSFDINSDAIIDPIWRDNFRKDLGLLVRKIDLPKFKIKTEVMNQYNRKTQVPTVLTYDPVNIEFHDDNSEITNGLWKNYYKYHVADSNYGDQKGGMRSFSDTKYGTADYSYGLDSYQDKRFFNAVDIYVLHQQNFTQITLINPKISAWDHDTLDQDQGNSILKNKMTLVYEDVLYNQGKIVKEDEPLGFAARYYNNVPSPITVGGSTKTSNTGQLTTRDMVFGPKPSPVAPPKKSSPAPTLFPEKNYQFNVGTPSVSQLQKASIQKPSSFAEKNYQFNVGTPSVSQLQRASIQRPNFVQLTDQFKVGNPVVQPSQLQKSSPRQAVPGLSGDRYKDGGGIVAAVPPPDPRAPVPPPPGPTDSVKPPPSTPPPGLTPSRGKGGQGGVGLTGQQYHARQQGPFQLTVTGLGGIQIGGGLKIGGVKLGFNVFSGRSGTNGMITVAGIPIRLTTKKR